MTNIGLLKRIKVIKELFKVGTTQETYAPGTQRDLILGPALELW